MSVVKLLENFQRNFLALYLQQVWVKCERGSHSFSLIWKNIISLFPLFYPHVRFSIGSGLSIRFWKRIIGGGPVFFLFLPSFVQVGPP